MKKWFIAAAAVAALGAGGAAMAQGSAQCQVDPASCSNWANTAPVPGRYYGYRAPNGYVQPGIRIAQGAWPRAYSQRLQPQYRHRAHYARTRRDRDGDGVPNAHDRYPNDPNRR